MYENITFEKLMERAVARIEEQNSNIDTREGSIVYSCFSTSYL